ncbi:MAG TPA: WhiB family transcriptional regulator [Propionibacteriaceae bacterium]|nr:WhiB family transcriptional regulator [Propionibacteriaceae bacterium]
MTRRAVQPALPLTVPPMPPAVKAELRGQIMPGWGQQAACASRQFDPDWWFAPAGDTLQTVARDICDGCPVRRSCLAHALVVNEPDGIWGGFDDSERAWLRLAVAEGTQVPAILDPYTRTAAA